MNRITLLVLSLILWAPTIDLVTGPAGVYSVTTSGPTRVTSGSGWVKIEWEVEPSTLTPPEPVKPPEPGPTVPPPPIVPTPSSPDVSPLKAGPAWIAAVYDEHKASSYPPGQQALLLSKTVGPALKAQQITWSVWKATDFDANGKWSGDIAGKPLPLILVISNQGHTSTVYSLPGDETAMMAMAQKLRGQN